MEIKRYNLPVEKVVEKVIAFNRRPALTSKMGICFACGKEFDLFHKSGNEMKKHIKNTGHEVGVESVYGQKYIRFRVVKHLSE